MGIIRGYKNIFLAAGFLILFGVSIFLREEISRMLSFGGQDGVVLIPPELLPGKKAPLAESESSPGYGAGVVVIPDNQPVITIPQYRGRDPSEVRPVPEEVKLFSEEQRGRLYATIDTHGRAVKANPAFFDGWIKLGLLKKTIGDFEGARDAWEYAGIIEPGNSLSFSNLGELYWRYLHEYIKSESNFRISIEHKPDDIQNYVSLAELYHYSYKDKADLADDVLFEGLGKNSGDGTLMRRLAYLYEQRGELASALEWWEKVLAGAPNDEEVKNKVEKIKLRL